MKGIIGKKLGMTQVFDQETGELVPVTVIQAGPCPVVSVRTADADGYDAVQLAWDEVPDKKLTKPEIGHLKKHGVGPHRKLVELRGTSELVAGETVTVEAFAPGEKVKVTGVSIGKGFQGTIKRHNFSRGPVTHGSHNVRAPGSIGASATPSRVFKGMKMAGQMGNKRRTQVGLTVHELIPEENLLLVRGAVPGHKQLDRRGARGHSLMAAPKAPVLDASGKKSKDFTLDEGVFTAEVKPYLIHEVVRAESAAARSGTSATKSRGLVAGRPCQAVAPEGHRSRPRRHDARRAVHGRRSRLPDRSALVQRSR